MSQMLVWKASIDYGLTLTKRHILQLQPTLRQLHLSIINPPNINQLIMNHLPTSLSIMNRLPTNLRSHTRLPTNPRHIPKDTNSLLLTNLSQSHLIQKDTSQRPTPRKHRSTKPQHTKPSQHQRDTTRSRIITNPRARRATPPINAAKRKRQLAATPQMVYQNSALHALSTSVSIRPLIVRSTTDLRADTSEQWVAPAAVLCSAVMSTAT